MTGFLLVGAAAGGAFVCWLRRMDGIWRLAADAAAFISYLAVIVIVGDKIVEVLVDDAVFMTQVHGVLLSELFLIGSAYLGVYGLGRMMERLWRNSRT